jgi:SAM-dependent methyltransferase
MNSQTARTYICPATGAVLSLVVDSQLGEEVEAGRFINLRGDVFPINAGVPDFTWPKELQQSDAMTLQSYEDMASDYDRYAALPFITYKADEHQIREEMLDALEIGPASKVLEIGCGTGRGAFQLAHRLSGEGRLFLQEISPSLIRIAKQKLQNSLVPVEFSIANGSYLPFPDNYFDAAHHFGGINTFAEIRRCLSELARVVKPGGKVVIGDEGLGPWLKETEMGRIMANSNPLLKCEPPMGLLPDIADEVQLKYIMMGAFYVIDFRVADAAPAPDYNMQIPSARGGSHWTRYFGQLEGVSDEAKKMAHEARKAAGLSMYDWLDSTVRAAAAEQLKNGRS